MSTTDEQRLRDLDALPVLTSRFDLDDPQAEWIDRVAVRAIFAPASEPSAPVDARDGLEQLFDLAKQYGYKLIPTPRAALAHLAAAPAEGVEK